ncbi:o-antigen polymerase [Firmicutes bacterium CAG:240]|nr:o-antigen polymerase [Firmicutes bacterium CAG:240]
MLKTLFKKGQTAVEAVWNSKYYLPFLLLTEFVAVFCDAAFECMCFYVFLCVVFMIFSDDLLSIMPTVMFTLLTAVSYYKDFSVLTQYMWYAIVPFALALLFNLIYYRRRMVIGKLTYPYIAVSAALIIGGVGVISADDYFEPIGLYYTLGLGLGQLVLYLISRSRLENERGYDRVERVARILYTGGLLFVVVVLGFYIQNIDKFIEKGGVLFFKQRNFVTSVFLMVIPMICILVRRSNLYLIGTVLMYIAMIMTGSRSGLLFGSFLLLVCLAYIYIKNKKYRRFYNWLFGVSIVVITVLAITFLPQLYAARIENAAGGGGEGTAGVHKDKTRLEFIKLGIENFLSHPIFGIGIANMKDVGIFKAYVPGSLMFYHNAVIQVISSMGLVGVLAYGWMLFSRLKMLWIGRKRKRIAVFALSYIGIGLMSMTNPGIFCPFPEAGLLTLMFAIVEKEEEKYKMEEEK